MASPKCSFPGCASTNFNEIDFNGIRLLVCENGHTVAADCSVQFDNMLTNAVGQMETLILEYLKPIKRDIELLKADIAKLKKED